MLPDYSHFEIPREDRYTPVTENEARYIHNFLLKHEPGKTIEVGMGYGVSAAFIISATNKSHVVIDSEQEKYSNLGLANLRKLGFEKFLVFETDFSHNSLPRLHREGEKFDFAFIDGGHKFDEIFIDFYYLDLMLNTGGHVLFHDVWMQSTQYVLSWIRNNKKNYKVIKTPIRNFALLRKESGDGRNWYHFKGFSTWRSFLNHSLYNLWVKITGKKF